MLLANGQVALPCCGIPGQRMVVQLRANCVNLEHNTVTPPVRAQARTAGSRAQLVKPKATVLFSGFIIGQIESYLCVVDTL